MQVCAKMKKTMCKTMLRVKDSTVLDIVAYHYIDIVALPKGGAERYELCTVINTAEKTLSTCWIWLFFMLGYKNLIFFFFFFVKSISRHLSRSGWRGKGETDEWRERTRQTKIQDSKRKEEKKSDRKRTRVQVTHGTGPSYFFFLTE